MNIGIPNPSPKNTYVYWDPKFQIPNPKYTFEIPNPTKSNIFDLVVFFSQKEKEDGATCYLTARQGQRLLL